MQGVGHQREPVLHRGVVRLPQVGGHDRRRGPGGPDIGDHAGPVAHARVRRAETAFQENPLPGRGELVVKAHILLREIRVGGDDMADPGRQGRIGDGPRLERAEVAGGHHQLVTRGQPEHVPGRRERLPGVVDDGHRVHRYAL